MVSHVKCFTSIVLSIYIQYIQMSGLFSSNRTYRMLRVDKTNDIVFVINRVLKIKFSLVCFFEEWK